MSKDFELFERLNVQTPTYLPSLQKLLKNTIQWAIRYILVQLHPKPTIFWIPPYGFWDIHFLFYLLLIWTCDKGLILLSLNVVVTMWIEYLSKLIFWELHCHIDKILLCLNLELVIRGQTHSIISKSYYWVICDTCDSWNSYFGELHGTFHILSIIGLN